MKSAQPFSTSVKSAPSVVCKSAFTLLELLVAITILSVLVVLLLGMVDSATKLWRENENRVESYREARAALNLISNDLRSLYASANTNFFAPEFPGFSGLTNSVGFLATLPSSAQDTASRSDLCTVAYFYGFGRGSSFSQKRTGNIYRYFIESNGTFTNLTTSGNFFNAASPDPMDVNPVAPIELLARNIADLQIRHYTITNGSLAGFNQSTNTPLPDLIEVSITAVNNQFAERLGATSETEWKAAASLPDYQRNIRTFTTRIPIRQPAEGL